MTEDHQHNTETEGKWYKTGPHPDTTVGQTWLVEQDEPFRIVAECMIEADADAICADHNAHLKLAAWHEAMTDVSVVNWTLSEENAEDLHKQLVAVIAQTVQEHLDPVVSEQARQLATAVKALERIHAAEGLDQFSPQTIAWQALEELKGHREVKQ